MASVPSTAGKIEPGCNDGDGELRIPLLSRAGSDEICDAEGMELAATVGRALSLAPSAHVAANHLLRTVSSSSTGFRNEDMQDAMPGDSYESKLATSCTVSADGVLLQSQIIESPAYQLVSDDSSNFTCLSPSALAPGSPTELSRTVSTSGPALPNQARVETWSDESDQGDARIDLPPNGYKLLRRTSSGHKPSLQVLPRLDEQSRQSSNTSQSIGPPVYELVRSTTSTSDPRSPVSDAGLGYASRLVRQASLPHDAKHVCPFSALRAGQAGLKDGTYLFVMMIEDPENVRLVHEEDLMASDWRAGHTSLVSRREFTRCWAQQWRAGDPQTFRSTVLYAGELEYRSGTGVLVWNNCSGHYQPDSEDHTRVPLSPSNFIPVDLKG